MKNQLKQKKQSLLKHSKEFLMEEPESLEELSKTDVQNSLHELPEANKIGLEMQNEELRPAQLEPEESRNKHTDFYDFVPVGYLSMNKKGLILEVNITGAALLGMERRDIINQLFSRYITSEDHDAFYNYRKRVLETKTRRSCDKKGLNAFSCPVRKRCGV